MGVQDLRCEKQPQGQAHYLQVSPANRHPLQHGKSLGRSEHFMVMPKGRFHACVHQQQGRVASKQIDWRDPE